MNTTWRLAWASGLAAFAAASALAGTFSANFNDNLVPAGSAIFGNTKVVGGVLRLTLAVNDQNGGFVIESLDPAATDGLNSFETHFRARVGGGTATPADGFSFSVAADLPDGTWREDGAGTGISVTFDTYDNGGGEAPSIGVKYNGQVVADTKKPLSFISTGANFVDVLVKLDPDGTLDLVYNGQTVYTNLLLPGFQPIVGARFGFGAGTGGANENHWIDDLSITTTTGPLKVSFTQEPVDLTGVIGRAVTLRSQVNDPASVTGYQWFRKAPGAGTFTAIPTATAGSYTTDLLTAADNGAQYQVQAIGANNTATSAAATLTTLAITLPPPTITLDFNDGALPAGTTNFGNATITADGGVGGTGTLRLTEPENGQNSTFFVDDFNNGKAIGAFVASFQLQIGPGTDVPADGFSVSWANDIAAELFPAAEEGAGSGLTVSFDDFDSGGGEAPAVDLKWGGQVLATKKVPVAQLATGAFVEVIVRLEADGTVDVIHDGQVLLSNVQIPGFPGLSGGRFAFAARTGGLNQVCYVDDIQLTTTLYAGPILITQQPAPAAVLVGKTATFVAAVNDPTAATLQWQKKGPSDANFSNINGATAATYTTPVTTAADSGTLYHLVATRGASQAISSDAQLLTVALARPTSPNINLTFDGTTAPANTAIYGSASLPGDGVLHLTDAVNGQTGSLVIADPDNKQAIESFVAAFDMHIDGGSQVPADGFGFAWASNLPNGTFGDVEEGVGSGLVVTFDIYDNAGGEGPAIGVKWKGVFLQDVKVPLSLIETGEGYAEALVEVKVGGKVNVAYKGQVLIHDLQLPGFTSVGGWRFGFGARTGGLNENQWIDNVAIKTAIAQNVVPAFTQQPASHVRVAGSPVTYSVQVNDPARITVKWQRKTPGGADFADIAGATGFSYTTPALTLANSGEQYRVIATSTSKNTATSDVADLTVVEITQPTPNLVIDFNSGAPDNSQTFGSAAVDADGGVANSGKLSITTAENGLAGSFIVGSPDGDTLVTGMVTKFKVQIGGGTTPPADGMSFSWAADLPDGAFGETGAGSGLSVGFDTYDNSPAGTTPEAPDIEISFGGASIGTKMVPAALLDTLGKYVDVLVRVTPEGTLDVAFDNEIVFRNLTLPGYAGIAGGRFGFGGRTGGLNENHFVDDIAISTSTTAAPVTLSVGGTHTAPVITYTGVLTEATSLNGAFTAVPGATSPYTVPLNAPAKFYRAVSVP